MGKNKIIGIVGGVGPYAGLDLNKKIFDQTCSKTDEEHLSVALISCSADIPNRLDYLMKRSDLNPADAFFDILKKLETIGAEVVGIACNSSHYSEIFDALKYLVREGAGGVGLLGAAACI